MNMKKLACLIMAAVGLVGEVFACATYARDVSDYEAMMHLGGYSYEHLPFTTHETVITLIAILSGLLLVAGIVNFFGNVEDAAKA